MEAQKTNLKGTQIVELLDKGYTRLAKQREEGAVDENGVGKSIQEYLENMTGQKITAAAINQMFKHPSLKGRKTKGFTRATTPKSMPFIFEDDIQETVSGEKLVEGEVTGVAEPSPVAETVDSGFSFS